MSKGDVLIVVDDSNPDWWDAKVASAPERHGFVPSNYVELIVGGAGDMPIYSELDDHWERKQAEFQLKKRIGYGQFGEVWLGSWNEATPEVAVKKLKPKTTRASLEHEFNILKALRHPNLLKLHGVCTAVEPFYIVTELMKNGTLFDYLNGKGSAIRLKQILDMAVSVTTLSPPLNHFAVGQLCLPLSTTSIVLVKSGTLLGCTDPAPPWLGSVHHHPCRLESVASYICHCMLTRGCGFR